jgi:hypothetical protein
VQMMRAKAEGRRVLVNIDDYLPAVPKQWKRGSHGHGHVFDAEIQRRHRECIGIADGALCSTPWLARKYSSVTETFVCRNGLDMGRYEQPPVEHDTRIIGWSGGTGHIGALRAVAPAIRRVMEDVPESLFVSQGDDALSVVDGGSGLFADEDGKLTRRGAHFTWSDLWSYPRDMACFWVGLAPAEDNDFYRAKSQLRFYEAAAVGVPLVAAPMYDEICHGVDGFLAHSEGEWYERVYELLTDDELRHAMSAAARRRALDEFDINVRAAEWDTAIGVVDSVTLPEPVEQQQVEERPAVVLPWAPVS